MAEVRGKDLAPRTKYQKTGISRIKGGQNPDYYAQYYQLNKEKILERNKQLRAIRKAKGIKNRVTPQTWRFMVISLLQQRDGSLCGICNQPLDFSELKTIQIDHIVPYSQTKDDTAPNLRLSHSICNQKRSRKHGNIQ